MVQNFKKRLFIELVIFLGVVLVMGWALFYFASSIGTNSVAIVESRKMLMSRSHAIENFATLRTSWNEKGKTYLKNLEEAIPVKDQLITLGKDFQSLAAPIGLEFSYASVGETPATPPNLGFIQFRISVFGAYDIIQQYIVMLQKFHYITSVDSISLSRSGNKYEAVLIGRTFFR